MAAKTLRQILGAGVTVMPVGERHAAADADLDAPAPLLEHFAHQQQRRQRPVDQRSKVEQVAVARADVDRHDRRARLGGQAQKAGMPVAVADALRAHARHFAGREQDQRALIVQLLLHAFNLLAAGFISDVIHRHEQVAQRFDVGQQLAGHHFHIRAHRRDGTQQHQAVERADRVIGHEHHRPLARNVFQIAVHQLAAEVEVVHHLLDQIEPFQVGIVGGELFEFFFEEKGS